VLTAYTLSKNVCGLDCKSALFDTFSCVSIKYRHCFTVCKKYDVTVRTYIILTSATLVIETIITYSLHDIKIYDE